MRGRLIGCLKLVRWRCVARLEVVGIILLLDRALLRLEPLLEDAVRSQVVLVFFSVHDFNAVVNQQILDVHHDYFDRFVDSTLLHLLELRGIGGLAELLLIHLDVLSRVHLRHRP